MSNSTKIQVVRFPFTLSKDGKAVFGDTKVEQYDSLAKAFLSVGYDKSESRVHALNEASVKAPYVIKVSATEYGAIIPERDDLDVSEYVAACRAKAEKKANTKATASV